MTLGEYRDMAVLSQQSLKEQAMEHFQGRQLVLDAGSTASEPRPEDI